METELTISSYPLPAVPMRAAPPEPFASALHGIRLRLGGAAVDLLRRDQVLAAVEVTLSSLGPPLFIASANLDHVHHFGRCSGRTSMFGGIPGGGQWLVLLDGMPLVWAARRLTGQHWDQLAGSDLLPEMLTVAATVRARVGFLGGSPAMHQALSRVLGERFPDLRVVGCWTPPRQDIIDFRASRRVAHDIRQARVDLLVVGLGKPHQELWLAEHGNASRARIALAFGAATDFLAGTVHRAPPRWRRTGLEWLYRLLHEPRRLGRRYLLQGPPALLATLRQSDLIVTEAPTDGDGPRWMERGRGTPSLNGWRNRGHVTLGPAPTAPDAYARFISSDGA